MTNTNNKRNALIGGLLVFMVPILAVSIVYFSASRLPKGKEIPLLMNANDVGEWQYLHGEDTIQYGSYWKDIKVIFHVDSSNVQERINSLNKITESTKEHAEFSLKDPYGQVYFWAVNDMENSTFTENLNHWFDLQEIKSPQTFEDKNRVYLLDRDENIRGQYYFNRDEISALDYDIQYLLQDTFYANADSLRIKRVFKTTLDEE